MNFKNAIITLTIIFCVIAVGYSFFNITDYKQKIDSLRSQNSVLEENRKRLALEFASLKKDLEDFKERETALNKKIQSQAKEIEDAKQEANKSFSALMSMRADLAKTRKKIKDLEAAPANRVGEDLLNSLKIKSQQ